MNTSFMAVVGLAARWLTFSAILWVVGAVMFRFAVVGRAAINGSTRARAERRAATGGAFAAAMVLPPAIVRLALQTAEMRFPGDPWISVGWRLVSETAWGTTWATQVAAAILLIPAFMSARQGGAVRWVVAGVLALVLAVTPTMSSHARAPFQLAAISPTADAIHVIAAGAWLGTLGVMFLSVVRNDGSGESEGRYLSRLLVVFSPLALVSAGLVVFSGVVSSIAHIDRVASLFGTLYGQTLIAKLAGVLVVFVLGWRNWRHLGPRAATWPSQMKRAMVIELVIAAIVLVITAALVVTPPPMDAV